MLCIDILFKLSIFSIQQLRTSRTSMISIYMIKGPVVSIFMYVMCICQKLFICSVSTFYKSLTLFSVFGKLHHRASEEEMYRTDVQLG